MKGEGVEEITLTNIGKLSLGTRTTWTYSQDIQNEEAELEAKKEKDRRIGQALSKENKYVIFKAE